MSVSAHTAFLMVTGIEAQRPWMHTCVWSRKSQTLRCSENHNRVHHGCGSLRKMSKVKNHLWETSNGCSEEFLTAFILFFTLLQISLLFIRTCVFSELRTHKSHNSVSQGFPYLDACKTSFYVEWKHFVFSFHKWKEKMQTENKSAINMCWCDLIVTSLSYSSLKVVLTQNYLELVHTLNFLWL